LEELRKELTGRHTFFDIVSKSKEMHRLFVILEQVAQSDSTVLLQGESGTGKQIGEQLGLPNYQILEHT
jgi:transcriptional regulator with PAS, ATPase and Fis domain